MTVFCEHLLVLATELKALDKQFRDKMALTAVSSSVAASSFPGVAVPKERGSAPDMPRQDMDTSADDANEVKVTSSDTRDEAETKAAHEGSCP